MAQWIEYNQAVNQIFGGMGATVIILVVVFWVLWRASVTVFKIALKVILSLIALGLGAAWYLEYWPWG